MARAQKEKDSSKYPWKTRPSEIHGYQRTIYLNDDSGDYLRVDFNFHEKRVRLYIEASEEGGNAYYSVITDGKITAEKSVSTGRSFGFTGKFKERAHVFSTIPNKKVLRFIGGAYGIGKKNGASPEKKRLIEETKKKYFKAEDEIGSTGSDETKNSSRALNFFSLADLGDFAAGICIAGALFYYYQFNFIAMGIFASFYGIVSGAMDMFIRGKSPVFPKIIFFILAGAISYIYGYYFP